MKSSFLLKSTWIEIFDALSDKQAGVLIKTLFHYNVNGTKPADLTDKEINAYFNMMVIDCNYYNNQYDRRCDTSAENGKKGGRPPKNQNLNNLTQNLNNLNNLTKPYIDIDIDIDIDKSKDLKEKINKKEKLVYSEFVSMLDTEYEKLVSELGEEFTKRCIEVLNNYKGSKGIKYKSDYLTIRNWVIKRVQEDIASETKMSREDHQVQRAYGKENGPVRPNTKIIKLST